MKLVQVTGNYQTQRALEHIFVQNIADILLNHNDTLPVVAEILQAYVGREQPGLTEKLDAINMFYSDIDDSGNITIPQHISQLTRMLELLYQQKNDETINNQRGAIVEVLGRKLICSRYDRNDTCLNSGRFKDNQGRDLTYQELDVAAFSANRLLVEAYECKLRANKLEKDDCDDLESLSKFSEERDCQAHVGVICFDSDAIVRKQLQRLRSANCIRVYGLESIPKLRNNPFSR